MLSLKHVLNVTMSHPELPVIFGECGNYPFLVRAYFTSMAIWLKIIILPQDCLPKTALLLVNL